MRDAQRHAQLCHGKDGPYGAPYVERVQETALTCSPYCWHQKRKTAKHLQVSEIMYNFMEEFNDISISRVRPVLPFGPLGLGRRRPLLWPGSAPSLFVIKQRTVLKKDSYTKRCRDTKCHGTAFFILLSFFVRENAVVSRKKCNFAI